MLHNIRRRHNPKRVQPPCVAVFGSTRLSTHHVDALQHSHSIRKAHYIAAAHTYSYEHRNTATRSCSWTHTIHFVYVDHGFCARDFALLLAAR